MNSLHQALLFGRIQAFRESAARIRAHGTASELEVLATMPDGKGVFRQSDRDEAAAVVVALRALNADVREAEKLLQEARKIVRCHARATSKDWDQRTTDLLARLGKSNG